MPIKWNLREWLSERGFKCASEVSRVVFDRTGYELSIQAVCDLLNEQPKMLRLETSEALCDAFYCQLSDFLEVKPRAGSRSQSKKVRPLAAKGLRGAREIESDSIKGDSGLSKKSRRQNSKVDFASFFPDARKFTSELSK
jgi:DNA-binding Xre family transcriptional regulator